MNWTIMWIIYTIERVEAIDQRITLNIKTSKNH